MTETICPSLAELGIEPGSFIRKLNNQNHWNTFSDAEDLAAAAQAMAAKVFGERGEVYSLWRINTDQDLYGVVAAITVNATPRDRNIDFIWVTDSELKEANIEFDNVPEGRCLRVKELHFDAVITQKNARQLCYDLLSKKRSAQRCKKAKTIQILTYQRELGCKAVDEDSQSCNCEVA